MEGNEKKNPLIQGDHSSINVKDLHNNVDNHTDSHDMVSNTTNNNTVNQNSTVVYNGSAANEKLLSERREEYRRFCEKNILSTIINRDTRCELDVKASSLQLDKATTEEIEQVIFRKLSMTKGMSKSDQVALEIAIEALQLDSGKEMVDKLVVLADKTEDEGVQFYANLALAVYDFRRCVQRYECKTFDSYWQTFWSYFAYKRIGNNIKAESTLNHLSAWSDYPDDQVSLLSAAGCLYDYFASNGSESLRRTANGYLKRCTSCSKLLEAFILVLQILISKNRPLYFSNDPTKNLYLRLFGAKDKPMMTMSQKAFDSPEPKSINEDKGNNLNVFEVAHQANNSSSISAPFQPYSGVDNQSNLHKVRENTNKPPTIAVSSPSTSSYVVKKGDGKDKKWFIYIIIGIVVIGVAFYVYNRNDSSKDKVEVANVEEVETNFPETGNGDKITGNSKITGNEKIARTSKTNGGGKTTGNATTVGGDKTTGNATTVGGDKTTGSATIAGDDRTTGNATTTAGNKTIGNDKATGDGESIENETNTGPLSKLDKLLAALNAGDKSAAYKIGKMYYEGDGVEKSNKAAFKYFMQAANDGNPDGMYWVGMCYRQGRGVQKDLDAAEKWWRMAAEAGNSLAKTKLKEFDTLM